MTGIWRCRAGALGAAAGAAGGKNKVPLILGASSRWYRGFPCNNYHYKSLRWVVVRHSSLSE